LTIEETADRYLCPGTKVRRDALWNGQQEVSEYGVVIHCWRSEELGGMHDCIVAFFGEHPPPAGQPEEQPYVLRYAAVSLQVLDRWPDRECD
jgi:hypothetical protein